MDHMTALVSCFARAYHCRNSNLPVFADQFAPLICEHLDAGEATEAFLKGSGMTSPAGVGYCLAVRKG